MYGDPGLIAWGRSEYLRREAAFVAAIAGGFVVVQLLLWAVGLTDSLTMPFGFIVPFVLLVAGLLWVIGIHQPQCRACERGLLPNQFLAVAEEDVDAARGALELADGRALAALALPEDARGPRRHLRVSYCPSCASVALVHLEREHVAEMADPKVEAALGGADARAVIAVAEHDPG